MDIISKKQARQEAINIMKLIKGFEGEPTDNAMKAAVDMSNYVLQLTNDLSELTTENNTSEANLIIPVVSNRRELFDNFYNWLDNISEAEYDDMSLTDKCEKYFFEIDK